MTVHHLEYLLHFGEAQEKFYIEKIPTKGEKKVRKCKKKHMFFNDTISFDEIIAKKKWYKKFDKYWLPCEENALKELKNFYKE